PSFLITLPRAPCSTLFPYTTLFRSAEAGGSGSAAQAGGSGSAAQGLHIATAAAAIVTAPFDGQIVYAGPLHPYVLALIIRHTDGDRKSTRLNSSHSQISYAVFCLKK